MRTKTLEIAVKSIPETGLERAIDLGPEWFSRWLEADPGLEFTTGAVTGLIRLEKHGKDILVRGRLEGSLQMTCGRCLEPFAAPVAADFDLLLVPGPWAGGATDEELSPGDLDQDFYSGEAIDLEAIIREQLILQIPLKPLCAETCRGICPRCGANRNLETCKCQAEPGAAPLGNLVRLKR